MSYQGKSNEHRTWPWHSTSVRDNTTVTTISFIIAGISDVSLTQSQPALCPPLIRKLHRSEPPLLPNTLVYQGIPTREARPSDTFISQRKDSCYGLNSVPPKDTAVRTLCPITTCGHFPPHHWLHLSMNNTIPGSFIKQMLIEHFYIFCFFIKIFGVFFVCLYRASLNVRHSCRPWW